MKTMKNENKNDDKNGKFDSKIIGHQITYVVNTIRESMDK